MKGMLVLLQLSAVMEELSAEITRAHGLTPHDVLVLAWMAERPGLPATDIAARVGRARQNVQRTLERLERRGLVERYESMIRDRTSGWGLTEKGQEQWDALGRAFSAREGRFKHHGVEVRRFVDALEKLVIDMARKPYSYMGLSIPEPEKPVPEWDL